jgi:hypothetical protein
VLPPVTLAAVLLAVNYVWTPDDVLVNVATELIGIVITVACVDWLFQKYQTERWRGAQSRAQDRGAASAEIRRLLGAACRLATI